MKSIHKIVAAVFVLLATTVNAQYKGPSSTKLYSAKDIKENAAQLDKADALVKIEGRIIDRINSDTFWFKDATGTLQVEIDKKEMPTFSFDEKTELIIVGKVDYDVLEEVEVEAKFIQRAK